MLAGFLGRKSAGSGKAFATSDCETHPASDFGVRAVFLQGPVGPFFCQLQQALDVQGWNSVRINFNAGDRLFAGQCRSVGYSGRPADWAKWFQAFLSHYQADVILLFGDQRPIHQEACAVANLLGVQIISFEEGYLRPDYITMEPGGNNAASALRAWRPGQVEAPPVPLVVPMPRNGFRDMANFSARYFAALHGDFFRFPYYSHHRQRGITRESALWARNAARKLRWRYKNLQTVQTIVEEHDSKYFIVALQVHDDLQLRSHGGGWTVEKLIESTIASFARNASPSHHLVIKGHPLDRGHSSGRELALDVAHLHKIQGRVHYVDDGSLGLLSRHSRGMVTINSTSAITSLGHARPVLALGKSFYESMTVNGADTSQQALDRFWRLTPQVDVQRWQAFCAQMIASSQVNGSYYIRDAAAQTCDRVIERLHVLLALNSQPRPQAVPSPVEHLARLQTLDETG